MPSAAHVEHLLRMYVCHAGEISPRVRTVPFVPLTLFITTARFSFSIYSSQHRRDHRQALQVVVGQQPKIPNPKEVHRRTQERTRPATQGGEGEREHWCRQRLKWLRVENNTAGYLA